jgi:hypothetical protein
MRKALKNNKEVIHVWAQQSQEAGYSGSLSFRDTTLYSYATPIANFVANEAGELACLITTETYNVTTSGKHMPRDYDIPDNAEVFYCKYIGVTGGQAYGWGGTSYHQVNMANYWGNYSNLLKSLVTVRNKDAKLDELKHRKSQAKDYAEFFGLSLADFEDQFPEPDQQTLEALKATLARERKERLAKEDQRKLELQPKILEEVELWRTYVSNSFSYEVSKDMPILLRVKPTAAKDTIQTSRGAEFPIDAALKAFPMIAKVRQAKAAYVNTGIRLGNFRIDKIDASGEVTAGCHTVSYQEIELLYNQLITAKE